MVKFVTHPVGTITWPSARPDTVNVVITSDFFNSTASVLVDYQDEIPDPNHTDDWVNFSFVWNNDTGQDAEINTAGVIIELRIFSDCNESCIICWGHLYQPVNALRQFEIFPG